MPDGNRWPATVVTCVALLVIGGLLVLDVPVVDILASVSVIGTLVSLALYQKATRIEANTNGVNADNMRLIRELLEVVKSSPPVNKD